MSITEAEAIINAARPESVTSNAGAGSGARKWAVWAMVDGRKIIGYGKTCEGAWIALASQMRRAA